MVIRMISRYMSSVSQKNHLRRFLLDKMRTSGPITVNEFMKCALNAPKVGYYQQENRIQFGEKGDFITSPEISQMFGELLAVWLTTEVSKLIKVSTEWQIVEFGPGTGELMNDVMKSFSKFLPNYMESLSINLVETSQHLRIKQCQKLSDTSCDEPIPDLKSLASTYGPSITWHSNLNSIPKNKFSIFFAHEFFDVLPVYKFEKGKNGIWREILVNSHPNLINKFTLMRSSSETIAQKAFLNDEILKLVPSDCNHVEVCAEGGAVVEGIANRINEFGGIALIVDYGHFGEKGDTLRGFKDHKLVDIFDNVGDCDVTTDVNFAYLAEISQRDATVVGPIEQKDFLKNLGIDVRYEQLLKNAKSNKEKEYLNNCMNILTNPAQMGSRFKVMAMYPKVLSKLLHIVPPCGFVSLKQ